MICQCGRQEHECHLGAWKVNRSGVLRGGILLNCREAPAGAEIPDEARIILTPGEALQLAQELIELVKEKP